ncbi:MAG: 30S ribosomal protein S4 [Deltaproteobacteria bacterium]|nr:30S ribosomal protein S4 [Deltaproteobacteria bacterium]
MARYIEAACRLCRREKLKLFLKGDRCYTDKCSFERRSYAPGQHGQRRGGKISDYGIQLREKQKAKRIYGILEKQFRRYYVKRRLDNIVFRMGFASSRNQARQLVRHNHFTVNGRKVNIPSFQVRQGDVIAVKEKSRKIPVILEAKETFVRREMPSWLEIDGDNFRGTVKAFPNREELTMPINEQLIVELYSK